MQIQIYSQLRRVGNMIPSDEDQNMHNHLLNPQSM